MIKTTKEIIPSDLSTWSYLIKKENELTKEEFDRIFCHHAATGGDMFILKNGQVICQ